MRKINVVISVRLGREIDNQMKNSKESCKLPHSFFQNSSASPLETDSSSHSGDTTNGVPSDSQKYPLSNSYLEQEELKENDSPDPPSPKDFSSPSTVEKVH